MAKSMLIISRQSPWSGPSAREALDIALAGGAFDLPLGILFLDDGVFQLQPAQSAQLIERKDLSANLKALPLFGVEALYASERSLKERGLNLNTLTPAVTALSDAAIGELINRFNHVITL